MGGAKAAVFLCPSLPDVAVSVKRMHVQKPWNMNSIAGWSRASAVAIGLVIGPQVSLAEGFTGKDFAGWSEASQDSFI